MADEPATDRGWNGIAAAALLGAIAMYFLDPDKGRHRRAVAQDKLRSALAHGARFAGTATRDLTHRIAGMEARAKRLLRPAEISDELQLIERVRACIGRVVSHPHAVQVGAYRGRIVLSGPILATEVSPLIDAIRSVPGVIEVDNLLVAHPEPGAVPSLQSDPRVHRQRSDANWTPASRAASIVAGILLVSRAVQRRTPMGLALASIGTALIVRAATNRPGRTACCRRDARAEGDGPVLGHVARPFVGP